MKNEMQFYNIRCSAFSKLLDWENFRLLDSECTIKCS